MGVNVAPLHSKFFSIPPPDRATCAGLVAERQRIPKRGGAAGLYAEKRGPRGGSTGVPDLERQGRERL